jgi:hypothetical protein
MVKRMSIGVLALAMSILSVYAQDARTPFPTLAPEEQKALTDRLSQYVKAYRNRDWKSLYVLVSDVGRGGISQERFSRAMKAALGTRSYADAPDLLEFTPERSEAYADGTDIYGCGKAKREGEPSTGIAVIHAVREGSGWFFSGWSFTEFPNLPCKLLSDPTWKPTGRMEWNQPMEEVRHATASKPKSF